MTELGAPSEGRQATILLTGAAGRIGTALRSRLPALGWDVRSFDRVPVPGGMVGDLLSDADLDTAVDGVSAIVHLAGQPFGNRSFAYAGIAHQQWVVLCPATKDLDAPVDL